MNTTKKFTTEMIPGLKEYESKMIHEGIEQLKYDPEEEKKKAKDFIDKINTIRMIANDNIIKEKNTLSNTMRRNSYYLAKYCMLVHYLLYDYTNHYNKILCVKYKTLTPPVVRKLACHALTNFIENNIDIIVLILNEQNKKYCALQLLTISMEMIKATHPDGIQNENLEFMRRTITKILALK